MSLAKPFNTRPLYQQVADEFIARIVSRAWAPGQSIENEADIARSLGISLGTVRKAFDILTDHKLLERQQGKGTVVVDFDGKMRSRFSNIRDRSGNRISGEIKIDNVELVPVSEDVANLLAVTPGLQVLRFERTRSHLGRIFMREEVFLRVAAEAEGLEVEELNELAFSRWNGHDLATRKSEDVTCEAASAADKRSFKLTGDAAILRLTRVVSSYQNRPLELRIGRCHLGNDLLYSTD